MLYDMNPHRNCSGDGQKTKEVLCREVRFGIFSLDLSKPITLEIYSDDCSDLLEEIKPFLAAEE